MNEHVIRVQLQELLDERGKTLYWLAKRTGVTYPALWNLRKGKTRGIDFRVLNEICAALECAPGDLLAVIPDKKERSIVKTVERVEAEEAFINPTRLPIKQKKRA